MLHATRRSPALARQPILQYVGPPASVNGDMRAAPTHPCGDASARG